MQHHKTERIQIKQLLLWRVKMYIVEFSFCEKKLDRPYSQFIFWLFGLGCGPGTSVATSCIRTLSGAHVVWPQFLLPNSRGYQLRLTPIFIEIHNVNRFYRNPSNLNELQLVCHVHLHVSIKLRLSAIMGKRVWCNLRITHWSSLQSTRTSV